MNFDKKINSILMPYVGTGMRGTELLFVLMEDGTVEYVPILKSFHNSKSTDITLKSGGIIPELKDIVFLSQGESTATCQGCIGGGEEAFAFKRDGSFYSIYDLDSVIKACQPGA